MTKIDIFSGFLGAGKTTLIKKLIKEAFAGEKLVLIENEFGEIGVDGGFMAEAGIQVTEMNSGCICCSLVGDFAAALQKVLEEYAPDRILIEPSGVGKLSDVIRAVQGVRAANAQLNSFTTVVDATRCKMYMKNFGEFFDDQVGHANAIVLSRTGGMDEKKLEAAVALLREHNDKATIVTTPWEQLTGAAIVEAMEHKGALEAELEKLAHEAVHEHHHHHHDHDHDHDHDHEHECCRHDHEHEHECHHHHDEEGHCCHHEHGHEHHHEHGESCGCGCHHDHDADEVFNSYGVETPRKFSKEEVEAALAALAEGRCGNVLRAKGIVAGKDGEWIYFDYVPGESDLRTGAPMVTGRLCVIGEHIDGQAVSALFGLN